ncbi:MAG: hypothetical protein F6K00_15420 [Leptolyngbya sp. SIOISBB]|nr:hypothetical protein [Leptolyngbya sp. SIOISBB]
MHSESLWMAVSETGWRQPETQFDDTLASQNLWRQGMTPILAQEQFEQDILADLGNVIGNFIESGQVWALLIGFVLGYILRGVTTYR